MIITQELLEKTRSGETLEVTLVYPKNPGGTYWGFEKALKFVGKKASNPPLGLLTVAAMLPENWNTTLIDMNVESLTDKRIKNSDLILLSGMAVQETSIKKTIERATAQNKTILFGGPYATKYFDFENVDDISDKVVWVLNEGEETVPLVLKDLSNGKLKQLYARPSSKDSLERIIKKFEGKNIDASMQLNFSKIESFTPKYELVKMNAYDSMIIQFSRGCPGGCEFCDVATLFGGKTRYRDNKDILKDLKKLYKLGWRGDLFIGDDNTIGAPKIATNILEEIIEFQKENNYPFRLITEMSLNIADRIDILKKYVNAGGKSVFLGIETPNPDSLKETGKKFNLSKETNPDNKIKEIANKISIIQQYVEVSGGFVVGFDSDDERVFKWQEQLIQEAGIPIAMVGLLLAPPGTPLYQRMKQEGRLNGNFIGNNTHSDVTNFLTKMKPDILAKEYTELLQKLYPANLETYFERALTMFEHQKGKLRNGEGKIKLSDIQAMIRSTKLIFKPLGPNYIKFLGKTFVKYINRLPDAIRFGICGYHLAEITQTSVYQHDLLAHAREKYAIFRQTVETSFTDMKVAVSDMKISTKNSYEEMKHSLTESVRNYVNTKPKDYQHRVQVQLDELIKTFQNMTPNKNLSF